MNFLTYLENISKTNVNILHSADEKHFCVRDANEMLDGMADGTINFPFLSASLETGDLKEMSIDNASDTITSGFIIIDKCENINDYATIMDIFDKTKKIGLSIIARMKFDKSNCFDTYFEELLSVKHKQYGPVFDNCYGTLFTLTYTEPINLLLDITDWNDTPNGQNIRYDIAMIQDSKGNKVASLTAGELFKIPVHRIINLLDGSIITQLEFNEDYYLSTGQKAIINNSIGNLIQELAAGDIFNIPKHNIVKNGQVIATNEFNEDYTIVFETAKVKNSAGVVVTELSEAENYNIPKHSIKKQNGVIVTQQEFNEDFAIQNTVVNDAGVQHEVEYGNTYTCSTLQERIISVDFSEGKTIEITITAKNRGTYTTLTTTLTATIKKNGNTVTLPFTVATGDSLIIDVATNGTLELGGTYE